MPYILILCVLAVCFCSHTVMGDNFTNFVLIGATGDLSRKYLWEALFVGFVEGTFEQQIRIYGAATRPVEQGTAIINSHIGGLHCKDTWSATQCADGIKEFQEVIQYVQLKAESDFQALQTKLSAPQVDPQTGLLLEESLRVFYLSVSPSLYDGLASNINRLVRPEGAGNVRVVFEKPFGRDLASAVALSEQLAGHLHEDEIFRVDHYLGKVGMQAIIEFRKANSALLHALRMPTASAADVSMAATVGASGAEARDECRAGGEGGRVAVVMKEAEDTAGRSSYYDQYGVIRDVFQNHLTQALVYAVMHLPPDSSEGSLATNTFGALEDRLSVLQALQYDETHDTVHGDENKEDIGQSSCRLASRPAHCASAPGLRLGQYAGYSEHLKQDHIEYLTRRDKDAYIDPEELARVQASTTPTAAAVAFRLPLSSTHEVGITISGGKALNTREMIVQVDSASEDSSDAPQCSVVFGIQGAPKEYVASSDSTSKSGKETLTTSGPFLVLKGACWSRAAADVTGASIALPSGWEVDAAHCHAIIGRYIDPRAAASGRYGRGRDLECLSRPRYLLSQAQSASGPAEQEKESSEDGDLPRSGKFQHNAYIPVVRALLANDRSFFTTTEELHQQWSLWDRVLADAACASPVASSTCSSRDEGMECGDNEEQSGVVIQAYQKGSASLL